MSEDRIYSMPLQRVGDFTFDENVVDVFPDMISRSVPGYGSVLAMTGELAERFAQPQTNIFDLGCSLGASTFLVRPRVPRDCQIIAIDSSPAMIRRLRDILSAESESSNTDGGRSGGIGGQKGGQKGGPLRGCPVDVREADIRDVEIEDASFAVLNFTLQFIPLAERADLLRKVCSGLNNGGALVLSEKIHFEDLAQQSLLTELHHDFKRAHGYSELEIAQKRTALENTLVTETISAHVARLRDVGFTNVSLWFQCFNFVSILAVK